jgi:hypothetical protein
MADAAGEGGAMGRRIRTAIEIVMLGIAGAPSVGAADSVLPEPIARAFVLLGWRGEDRPRVEVVASRAPDASPLAAGWVRFNHDGCALPVIYVTTVSHIYRDAAGGDYQALIQLAGVLAHERWHVQHGRDEVGAYTAQLSIMEHLHANSLPLLEVRKALRGAEQQNRNRRRDEKQCPSP